jgi:hypothetical protein
MSANPDRLYDLLPVVYRLRDADRGYPLRGLLQVISEQVNLVEADIAQLYENWFIETCRDWVIPYVGDLIGYMPVHEAGEPGDVATPAGEARNRILIPRREVANTIRYRRRKGAVALLEELALAVARWPSRAVEFYRLLGLAQNINYLHLDRGGTADLRDGDALDRLDGAFDELAHTVDVRRVDSNQAMGRYSIPSVGVFVCRLKAYSVAMTLAHPFEERPHECYFFSALGNNTQLFTNPRAIAARPLSELDLPLPIRRRPFEESQNAKSYAYYGTSRSLRIWFGSDRKLVTPDQIVAADLTDWLYRPAPQTTKVAVDPVLGRIAFPARSRQFPPQSLRDGVWVSYYYGFNADIGGGEYARPIMQPAAVKLYLVGENEAFTNLIDALSQWQKDQPAHAVIEMTESGLSREREPVNIILQEKQSLQIRAAKQKRAVIHLADNLTVSGKAGSTLVLDGLLIAGHGVEIEGPEPNGGENPAGDLCSLTIRHSTLVPGWELHSHCAPKYTEPSLQLFNTRARVIIEHSIVGSIQVQADEVQRDPMRVEISDSIVDATDRDGIALHGENPLSRCAYATLTIARSTIIGELCVHAIELAENSIFYGTICAERRQRGCMRFCYVTPDSRTPRRYECQPDLVDNAVADKFRQSKTMSAQERDALQQGERLRVEPEFNSMSYGMPTYCQLADACADEIKRGADDEAEMGVFHDLFQPQRVANLRTRLDEYTPAGMDSGIIYAT